MLVVHADQLLPHMRRVQVAERDLCDLSVLWQMIETSAAISCPVEVASLMPTLIHNIKLSSILYSIAKDPFFNRRNMITIQ